MTDAGAAGDRAQVGREFGPDDRLGALNYIQPQRVKRAAGLVRKGETIGLNLPLEGPPFANRPSLRRTVRQHNMLRPIGDGKFVVVNDDSVEIALQGSSQWDAFAHFGAVEPGVEGVYYGGRGLEETYPEPAGKTLGIDAWSDGIAGRGVLIDTVAVLGTGDGYLSEDARVGSDTVAECLERQELQLEPGDIVLVYTGFQRQLTANGGVYPEAFGGVDAETLGLWERSQIGALVSDNPSVEPFPVDYALHIGALRNLGIPLGELWALERLAQACREDGVYDFLLVSAPLNVAGGFGSPANALAIR